MQVQDLYNSVITLWRSALFISSLPLSLTYLDKSLRCSG